MRTSGERGHKASRALNWIKMRRYWHESLYFTATVPTGSCQNSIPITPETQSIPSRWWWLRFQRGILLTTTSCSWTRSAGAHNGHSGGNPCPETLACSDSAARLLGHVTTHFATLLLDTTTYVILEDKDLLQLLHHQTETKRCVAQWALKFHGSSKGNLHQLIIKIIKNWIRVNIQCRITLILPELWRGGWKNVSKSMNLSLSW